MIQQIKDFLIEDREYFRTNKQEITVQNNHMLLDGCVAYAVVLLFYTILTISTGQPSLLVHMYFAFDLIHVALCLAVILRTKQRKKDFRTTQFYCVLLELTLLGFFALEGVFVDRKEHSLYIPIAILLVLLLFIHQVLYSCVITSAYVVIFGVLSCLYKTKPASTNDLYIAIATFISATIGYVLIAKMRHKEAAALTKYENLSRMDQLTGLLNKAAIERLCGSIVAEVNHPCAFLILDLDNFKSVNDLYGHDVGDEVLSLVGQALRMSFRESDYIGRFGGDEFIVLMDYCRDLDTIIERAEHVIGQIGRLRFSKEELQVQCSVGITMKQHEDVFTSIFKRADEALYEAKAQGKGGYQIAKGQ